MQNYYWSYNDNQFQFDFDDIEDAQRYKDAVNALGKQEAPDRSADPVAYLNAYCNGIYLFFDTLFGDGTSKEMFQGNPNKRVCDDAYQSFLQYVVDQVQESNTRILNAIKKYAPAEKE